MSESGAEGVTPPRDLPFPASLCHQCGAPPRFITTDKGAVFIQCPILKRYPPQPVRSCEAFIPRNK